MPTGLLFLLVVIVVIAAVAVMDRRSVRRRTNARRQGQDRPSIEQPPPGDGFHPNNQSWS
jgi:hypothetical protein